MQEQFQRLSEATAAKIAQTRAQWGLYLLCESVHRSQVVVLQRITSTWRMNMVMESQVQRRKFLHMHSQSRPQAIQAAVLQQVAYSFTTRLPYGRPLICWFTKGENIAAAI